VIYKLMSLFMYAQGIFIFFLCKNEKYQEGINKKETNYTKSGNARIHE
jgi:hypothetical protein